ncbi:MAG: very short patch repair endonuclease [Chloroflexi bacterium]|nr:very short patch repair endonuclease [Chloroflexota bacterium]
MSSIRSRAPAASSAAVRRVMQANTGVETRAEILLRSALHRSGLRFRKNASPAQGVRCKADVVFVRARVCVFVDGCFWHGCPKHFRAPKTNRVWWLEKMHDNQQRDIRQAAELRARGWTVIRVWEHDVQARPSQTVSRIRTRLARVLSAPAKGF